MTARRSVRLATLAVLGGGGAGLVLFGALYLLTPPQAMAPVVVPAISSQVVTPPPARPTVIDQSLPLAGLEMIADNPPAVLTLYRARHNPQVVVLDFPSLHAQALALNRLAALLEKARAPRDRLASLAEIEAIAAAAGTTYDSFYVGHDYPADAIARFFNLGADSLTPEEVDIRRRLIDCHVLTLAGDGHSVMAEEPMQAVISLARFAPPVDAERDIVLRRLVLRHEFAHGEYFTRLGFRMASRHFVLEILTEDQRRQFVAYLGKLGYDTTDRDLMINEIQAFLGFTSAETGFGPASLGVTEQDFTALRAQLLALLPPPIEF